MRNRMSLWDDVEKEFGEDIDKAAAAYIKASNIFPYTVNEIRNVFSPEEEQVMGHDNDT